MSILYIPSPTDYKELFSLSLENQQFQFEFQYNDREDSWYLGLQKNNVYILNFVKLVMGIKFGANYQNFPLTQGWLEIFSPVNNPDDPNLENFGNGTYLVYRTED